MQNLKLFDGFPSKTIRAHRKRQGGVPTPKWPRFIPRNSTKAGLSNHCVVHLPRRHGNHPMNTNYVNLHHPIARRIPNLIEPYWDDFLLGLLEAFEGICAHNKSAELLLFIVSQPVIGEESGVL